MHFGVILKSYPQFDPIFQEKSYQHEKKLFSISS
jgi:hypothetical protein